MGKKSVQRTSNKPQIRKTRKQIRKELRKEKKLRRSGHRLREDHRKDFQTPDGNDKKNTGTHPKGPSTSNNHEKQQQNEKLQQEKLKVQMEKSRKKQLLAANEDEDKNIRQLEKLLKLNRKKGNKGKSLPKSFSEDGLGYLLEVCDSEMIKDSVKIDQALQDSGSEFEEDFAAIKGKTGSQNGETKKRKRTDSEISGSIDDKTQSENEDSSSDFGLGHDESSDEEMTSDINAGSFSSDDGTSEEDDKDDKSVSNDSEFHIMQDKSLIKSSVLKDKVLKNSVNKIIGSNVEKVLRKSKSLRQTEKPQNDLKNINEEILENESFESDGEEDDTDSVEDSRETIRKSESKKNSKEIWEDIYGRTRDNDGNVIDKKSEKYIPPALRAKLSDSEDVKRKENLIRLQKQMKGLINRLAENNMASICAQIDELFMKNSRHDMNETLLSLFMEALVSPVLTPERLIMEHMLLISVLHANVGTEVGAHFLQHIMKKFQDLLDSSPEVENKELDNIILILSHLYNFKVYSASLLYEVLDKVAERLDEKRIELLLVVLRSVGFSLRKDDPLALKSLILKLQGKASNCSASSSANSRVKFMLDILMAIKNNNMSKIPSYNPEYIEHLKKLLRTLVRRGNYVAELKITLDDLLKAEERGRWWIVGSAWTGHLPGENPTADKSSSSVDSINLQKSSDSSYSAELLELARKQRMNTGVRKDIFCILMTAEDFLDAFEKLLHLNLKNQQRQEIVHVLFDCCLQEKTFNLYYAHLAQKFCDFDRQYQMKFQYCLWDKLKEIDKLSSSQLSNMAKFLAHLFLEKGLPLSSLKVMSFAEMDKPCVRLFRQILLIILLSEDQPKCEAVFRRIAVSTQLRLFREGLRLFLNHFVLRKGSTKSLPEEEFRLLQERAKIAERALTSADAKMEF